MSVFEKYGLTLCVCVCFNSFVPVSISTSKLVVQRNLTRLRIHTYAEKHTAEWERGTEGIQSRRVANCLLSSSVTSADLGECQGYWMACGGSSSFKGSLLFNETK